MAKILILGGGFAGVAAAETLAKQLNSEHEITLISRSREFVFYPHLVKLAFGDCEIKDVTFDLRSAMLDRRIAFMHAEVARINPYDREVILAHGDVHGTVPYDYLLFALGRRLATERVSGFFEHAHHLLDVNGAVRFGSAVQEFTNGRAVIGQCPDGKLPVPVYECALRLKRLSEERGDRQTLITIVSPTSLASELGDEKAAGIVKATLERNDVQYISNFPIRTIGRNQISSDSETLTCNLLMLVPPFRGSSAAYDLGVTPDGFLNVDWTMKVLGIERMYAAGDCVAFDGPKLGHMAVHQAEVAAANLASEIEGHGPVAHYNHELMLVIEDARESIYFRKDLWSEKPSTVHHGQFWSWAKNVHAKYWQATHN